MTVLCELTRDFHPALSPSCGAEDPWSGEWFQVGLDRGCPRLQLVSSSSAPRARQCGEEKVLDHSHLRAVLQHGQTSEAFFARAVSVSLVDIVVN